MPTGYAAPVQKGETTFNEFVMNCARAFGACITLRDSNAPIPEEFEASNYHVKEHAEAVATLDKLKDIDADAKALEAYAEEMTIYNERVARMDVEKRRYSDMLQEVKDWTPPTSDHTKLKEFMIQQLTDSRSSDCYNIDPPKQQTGTEWLIDYTKKLTRDVNYHLKEMVKEQERVNGRSQWVKDLRGSLKC